MKLREANAKILDNRRYAAVYDELLALLDRALEGELKIPIASDEEYVEDVYVDVVRSHIEDLRDGHAEQIRQLEEMEISDVEGRTQRRAVRKRAATGS